MTNHMRALVTIILAATFSVAYAALGMAVGRQSTQLTETAMLWIAISGVLYLLWLWSISRTKTAALAAAARLNFKRTSLGLLGCIPAAFLFIGMLAPPFIISASAAFLVGAMFKSHGGEAEL